MSGGSYNYLCHAFPEDLSTRMEDIAAVAKRLHQYADEGTPHARLAARATEDVLATLRVAGVLADRMNEVWHAIEWRDSCDYGDDDVVEALASWADGKGK